MKPARPNAPARCAFFAASGVVLFALTLTMAAILFMKGLMSEWYSTMYGVTYFAASVWVTLPTVYVITLILQRTTALRDLVKENTYYMIGSLFLRLHCFLGLRQFLAILHHLERQHAGRDFLVQSCAKRAHGMYVGKYVIIFGHFFIPFLMLLRIDFKLKLVTMLPLAAWAWFMHFVDLEFQIMPALHKNGHSHPGGLLVDAACVLFFAGVLMKVLIVSINRHPVYPQKDPRMSEALGIYVPPHTTFPSHPSAPNELGILLPKNSPRRLRRPVSGNFPHRRACWCA
jgi:hypothetical protein